MPEVTPQRAANPAQMRSSLPQGPVRRWIVQHDDSWLFIVPYIGLAVVLSIAISLFWLVALVVAHFVLEWVRQIYEAQNAGDQPGFGGLLLRVLWELKLDLALIVFALVLAVYMEMALGVVGLGAAGRSGAMATARAVGRSGAMTTARVGSRFAVLQRVLRGVLLSLDDAAQVARAILQRRGASPPDEAATASASRPLPDGRPGLRVSWSKADYAILGFGTLSLVLLMLAPVLTDHDVRSLLLTLAKELHPTGRVD